MEKEKQELIAKLKEQSASYKYKDEHEKYLLANKIVYIIFIYHFFDKAKHYRNYNACKCNSMYS